ncbi:hypothetical protein ABZ820_34610 [Streptomyces diacarni]|uniref:hypothetical protein n=1 Tax=Streptomyces diacarni TaxID=2800381 RepID=UPI0033F82BF1
MRRSRRAWRWIGGVWLLLVVVGGAATLALAPGDRPSADGETSPTSAPGHQEVSDLPESCADEDAEARDHAGPDGTYAIVCQGALTASEVPSPLP